MARPVFVVGKHRSGTTWLANLLCELPPFAGIQHAAHFGIHESGYFSYVWGRFGDLQDPDNFKHYVRVMAASDYFRLAGSSPGFIESLWPASYGAIFRKVMDRYATGRGASHWVEKSPSHTPLLGRIAAEYPDALFVAIRRDLEDVVMSTLTIWAPKAGRLRRFKTVIKTAGSWEFYNKCISRFRRRTDRVMVIEYRDLRESPSKTVARVCEFTGAAYVPPPDTSSYASNTSYPEGRRPQVSDLSLVERWAAKLASSAVALVPTKALICVHTVWRRLRTPPLPDWFFRLRNEVVSPE